MGRYKTWTLDSGLDSGLDYGLDYGLDFGLSWTVNSVLDLLFKRRLQILDCPMSRRLPNSKNRHFCSYRLARLAVVGLSYHSVLTVAGWQGVAILLHHARMCEGGKQSVLSICQSVSLSSEKF